MEGVKAFDECSMSLGARGAREEFWIMGRKNKMTWTHDSKHKVGEGSNVSRMLTKDRLDNRAEVRTKTSNAKHPYEPNTPTPPKKTNYRKLLVKPRLFPAKATSYISDTLSQVFPNQPISPITLRPSLPQTDNRGSRTRTHNTRASDRRTGARSGAFFLPMPSEIAERMVHWDR